MAAVRAAAYAAVAGAPVEPLEGRVFLATHLPAVADAYVRNNDFKAVNFGEAPFLWVKTPGNGDARIAYLKFNVDDFNPNDVGAATLYLSAALQAPTTPPIQIGVYGVGNTTWVEGNGNYSVRSRGDAGAGGGQLSGTGLGDGYDSDGNPGGELTWNNQPELGAQLASDTVSRETFQTYAFDVSGHVRQAVNAGEQFVSLAVRSLEPSVNFLKVISREFAGPGRPQLVVTEADQPDKAAVRSTVSVQDVAAPGGGPAHAVTVTYSSMSGAPVDYESIDPSDIAVARENGAPLPITVGSVDAPFDSGVITVTYHVAGPGGSWERSDNGVYVVDVRRDAVRDTAGNENTQAFGSFRARVDDNTRPTASVAAPAVTTPGGNTYSFTVNYSDDNAVNAATLNLNNVGVSAPGNSRLIVQSVSLSPDADAQTVAATYTVSAPGGTWDAGDNGTYVITVRNTQVRDTAGLDITEFSQPFTVDIGLPDTERPTANVSAADIRSPGGTTHTVTVVYSDDRGIDVETLDAGDISVTGPGGPVGVQFGSVTPGGDGTPRSVTYYLLAPGGTWNDADNGTYTVTVGGDQVRDTTGNGVTGASTTFAVDAREIDTTPPTAAVSANNVTTEAGDRYSFTVTYADNVAINGGTISADDVTVSGPGGALQVIGVTPNPAGNAAGVTVTYTVLAPGGSWNAADNGTYTIALNPGNVRDLAGNSAVGAGGSFSVGIAGPDTQAPTASITAANIESGGVVIHLINVTYSDNVGIDFATIGREDISVVGADGVVVPVQSAIRSGDIVTYGVQAPNGEWNAGDDGDYRVTLLPDQVRDIAGNAAASVSAGFSVNISGRDEAGPTASIDAKDVTSPGGATHTITVVYTDGAAVNGATIGTDDITVTRDGVAVPVTGFTRTPATNAGIITATYTINAPGGSWDLADNGTYVVTVVNGRVTDKKGNGTLGGTATFTVNTVVPDAAPPAATISTSDVVTPGSTPHTVLVAYVDDVGINTGTIHPDDLTIAAPDGRTLTVTWANQTPSSDGKGVSVVYEVLPADNVWDAADNGTYTITVNQGSVLDAAGKPVTALPMTFNVAVPNPEPIDPGFGGGKGVNVDFVTNAVTAQPDGKIVLVGRMGNPETGTSRGVIQRLTAEGLVDGTFGGNGRIETAGGNIVYHAVLFYADRIYVAGSMDGDFVLAAYDLSGAPVAGFGQAGRSIAAFLDPSGAATGDTAYALSVAPDGKLVLAGSSGENFAFARFDQNGVLDPTFAQGGRQVFSVNGHDVIGAVAVQGDHRILAVGSSGPNVTAVRLNPNGEIDATFGNGGLYIVPGLVARQDVPQFIDRSQALAIQPDGRILIGNRTADNQFGIVRIQANGQLDPTFGTNGTAAVEFGGDDDVDTILLQDTGYIIAIGTSSTPDNRALVGVVAFDRNGALLTEFGQGGKLTYETQPRPLSRELHIGDLVIRAFGTRQPDGRIVVGNGNSAPAPTAAPIVRLQVPGALPGPQGPSLGPIGIVEGSRRPRVVTHTDADGTVVTFTMRGGSGTVHLLDGKYNLVINPDAAGASVVIKARGGNGRYTLGDVTVNGQLRSFNARGGDLTGTMYVTGSAGKMRLGQIDGTLAVAGIIASLLADGMNDATVLSGAILGTNGDFGGTGADADQFREGTIGVIRVLGAITGSTIGAGLNPVDASLGNGNDVVIAGSTIRSISARGGADETSRFAASSFGSVRLPKAVKDLSQDPRFQTA